MSRGTGIGTIAPIEPRSASGARQPMRPTAGSSSDDGTTSMGDCLPARASAVPQLGGDERELRELFETDALVRGRSSGPAADR